MTTLAVDGLSADVADYLIRMGFDQNHVTTVGLSDDQTGTPMPTTVIVQPLGGFNDDRDLVRRRLQVRVVAEREWTARQTFARVARLLLAYPNATVVQAAEGSDMTYDFGQVSVPTHGADFYCTVPDGIPA